MLNFRSKQLLAGTERFLRGVLTNTNTRVTIIYPNLVYWCTASPFDDFTGKRKISYKNNKNTID